ncbi:dolichyl-diphosphooligosaccharide--protein glycosyltransferase subunit 1, partial [Mycoemilia scoparia]
SSDSLDGLVNNNVIREVNLKSTSVIREKVGISISNENKEKTFSSYPFPLNSELVEKLGHIGAEERKSNKPLNVIKRGYDKENDSAIYDVYFDEPLKPGDKISININLAFVRQLRPLPAKIGLLDHPSWVWNGNGYISLMVPSKKQKTIITLPQAGSTAIRNFSTQPSPASTDGKKKITYGPYSNVGSFSNKPISIHYDNDDQNLHAFAHRREMHVSHWGNNLNVLEHYQIHNDGATLNGPFDKVAQQLASIRMKPQNAVLGLPIEVPVLSRNIYFVDEIGNVSTSNIYYDNAGNRKFIRLAPRYPLVGGWNYTWWHGYDMPLDSVLKYNSQDGRYNLKVKFYEGMVDTSVDKFELQVVLPEGAIDIQVANPLDVNEESARPYYTYFDSTGRTMLVFSQYNVVNEYKQDIHISYRYSLFATLQKPIILSLAIFSIFLLTTITSRLSIGLTKLKKQKKL